MGFLWEDDVDAEIVVVVEIMGFLFVSLVDNSSLD